MKCPRIMELLASDYIDGELNETTRSEVLRHLATCARCREFEGAVRTAAVEPLRGAAPCQAPSPLRGKVLRMIEREKSARAKESAGTEFSVLFRLRRPAYAAAAAAAMILVAYSLARLPLGAAKSTAPLPPDKDAYDYLMEQRAALASLGGSASGGIALVSDASGEGVNFGTVIEEFLM